MSESFETSPAIIRTLVGEHERFLRFLLPRVESREAAEEILQSAFVKSLEKVESIRDEESVVAWFYQLLRNSIVDHHRKRGVHARALEREASLSETEDRELFESSRKVICECVGALIGTLKPEYERILRRVDLEGASVPDVAEEEGITANNAGVRLHRARTDLLKRLKQTCGTCTEHGCLECHCKPRVGNASPSM